MIASDRPTSRLLHVYTRAACLDNATVHGREMLILAQGVFAFTSAICRPSPATRSASCSWRRTFPETKRETAVSCCHLTLFLVSGIAVRAIRHARVRKETRQTVRPKVFERLHFIEDFWLQARLSPA